MIAPPKPQSPATVWQDNRIKVARQLFPDLELTDPKVQQALEYLDDCAATNKIHGPEFYRYFPGIVREAVGQAMAKGVSLVDIIIQAAQQRSTELFGRELKNTTRELPLARRADGQRYRGGSGARAS